MNEKSYKAEIEKLLAHLNSNPTQTGYWSGRVTFWGEKDGVIELGVRTAFDHRLSASVMKRLGYVEAKTRYVMDLGDEDCPKHETFTFWKKADTK